MKLITFTNYDGVSITVPLCEIESIREPSGRVNDHGGLILKSGRGWSFHSDSTATNIKAELAKM